MEARTECRAVGVVANKNVGPLAASLRGMCSKYGGLDVHEVVMRAPLDSNNGQSTQLRLARRVNKGDQKATANPFTEKPPDRWGARGMPVSTAGQRAGPGYHRPCCLCCAVTTHTPCPCCPKACCWRACFCCRTAHVLRPCCRTPCATPSSAAHALRVYVLQVAGHT